jgi:hypothetical protein
MGGFSGITAASGWLIAALGISIVFLGLASLAFIISLFPYVIGRLNGQTPKSIVITLKDLFYPVKKPSAPATPVAEERLEEGDLDDAEESLRLLTAHLGEPFKLPRLLMLAEHRLAKPHSTICRLILQGKIVREPDGLFRWAKGYKEERSP